MAGAAKPNVEGLGKEGRHRIVSENLYYPNSAWGLFSGACESGWQDGTGFWALGQHSLEIELLDTCRIWRSGYFAPYYYGKLRCHKKNDDGTYTEITDQPSVHNIGNGGWEVFTTKLSPGIYRFSNPYDDPTGYGRIDSEWYIEKMTPDTVLFLGIGEIISEDNPLSIGSIPAGGSKQITVSLVNYTVSPVYSSVISCESTIPSEAVVTFKESSAAQFTSILELKDIQSQEVRDFDVRITLPDNVSGYAEINLVAESTLL